VRAAICSNAHASCTARCRYGAVDASCRERRILSWGAQDDHPSGEAAEMCSELVGAIPRRFLASTRSATFRCSRPIAPALPATIRAKSSGPSGADQTAPPRISRPEHCGSGDKVMQTRNAYEREVFKRRHWLRELGRCALARTPRCDSTQRGVEYDDSRPFFDSLSLRRTRLAFFTRVRVGSEYPAVSHSVAHGALRERCLGNLVYHCVPAQ